MSTFSIFYAISISNIFFSSDKPKKEKKEKKEGKEKREKDNKKEKKEKTKKKPTSRPTSPEIVEYGELPPDWSELIDKNGSTYYFNSKTTESTYRFPGPTIGKSTSAPTIIEQYTNAPAYDYSPTYDYSAPPTESTGSASYDYPPHDSKKVGTMRRERSRIEEKKNIILEEKQKTIEEQQKLKEEKQRLKVKNIQMI
jgi:hypothetical protein